MSAARHHGAPGGPTRERPDRWLLDWEVRGPNVHQTGNEDIQRPIAGGISLGNIEVDPQGVVKRATAARLNLTPIFGVTRKGATVTFFIKEGKDTDQFELRLLENGDADLHFLLNDEDRTKLAAEGVPIPKPIHLQRPANQLLQPAGGARSDTLCTARSSFASVSLRKKDLNVYDHDEGAFDFLRATVPRR